MVQPCSFISQSVDVRSFIYAIPISTDRFGGVIVCHDEDDIWPLCHNDPLIGLMSYVDLDHKYTPPLYTQEAQSSIVASVAVS
jgi:hypothetical protein